MLSMVYALKAFRFWWLPPPPPNSILMQVTYFSRWYRKILLISWQFPCLLRCSARAWAFRILTIIPTIVTHIIRWTVWRRGMGKQVVPHAVAHSWFYCTLRFQVDTQCGFCISVSAKLLCCPHKVLCFHIALKKQGSSTNSCWFQFVSFSAKIWTAFWTDKMFCNNLPKRKKAQSFCTLKCLSYTGLWVKAWLKKIFFKQTNYLQ